MKSDLNDLKKLTLELLNNDSPSEVSKESEVLIQKIYGKKEDTDFSTPTEKSEY